MSDEGGYWENRDIEALVRKFAQVQVAAESEEEPWKESLPAAVRGDDAENFDEELEHLEEVSLVQLKRALRGVAFARGSLFSLRAEGQIDEAIFNEFSATLEQLESGILTELAKLRGQG